MPKDIITLPVTSTVPHIQAQNLTVCTNDQEIWDSRICPLAFLVITPRICAKNKASDWRTRNLHVTVQCCKLSKCTCYLIKLCMPLCYITRWYRCSRAVPSYIITVPVRYTYLVDRPTMSAADLGFPQGTRTGGSNLLFGQICPKTAWKWRKLDWGALV